MNNEKKNVFDLLFIVYVGNSENTFCLEVKEIEKMMIENDSNY